MSTPPWVPRITSVSASHALLRCWRPRWGVGDGGGRCTEVCPGMGTGLEWKSFTGRLGSNREPKATARSMVRRETHDAGAARPCGEEVRGEPQHRTQVNSWAGQPSRGKRAFERDAQSPTEAGAVMGAAAAGHPVFLFGEVWAGPCQAVGGKEAMTTSRRQPRSRISSYKR
jgi:hypothetical protein